MRVEPPDYRPFTARRPRGRKAPRAIFLALLLVAALAGPALVPLSAQTLGPLAPPVGKAAPSSSQAPAAPATAPRPETPQQRQDRLLVQALRHQGGGWSAIRQRTMSKLIDFIPAFGASLLVMVGFYFLYRVVTRLLHGLMRRSRAHPAVLDIGVRLTKFFILGFGFVMAASQLGFQVGSVLAGLGIVGLALGLAAQDSLANLVAGITILWDHPFRIGDNVTIAGTYGQVKEIGLRTTRILTNDRIDAILPNKDVINQKILNHTLTPQLRLGVPVGIGYEEEVEEARRALLAAVDGHPKLLPDPEPKVVVKALGESAVELELRVWLRDAHAEREVFFELLELVKRTLDEAGIEMPYPQRTLRFAGKVPVALAEAGRGPVAAVPPRR